MKVVKVLGGGCSKCDFLSNEVKKAASELDIQIKLEKVQDYAEIAKFSVMSTPALVVDGNLIFQGQIKKSKEIQKYLK